MQARAEFFIRLVERWRLDSRGCAEAVEGLAELSEFW